MDVGLWVSCCLLDNMRVGLYVRKIFIRRVYLFVICKGTSDSRGMNGAFLILGCYVLFCHCCFFLAVAH